MSQNKSNGFTNKEAFKIIQDKLNYYSIQNFTCIVHTLFDPRLKTIDTLIFGLLCELIKSDPQLNEQPILNPEYDLIIKRDTLLNLLGLTRRELIDSFARLEKSNYIYVKKTKDTLFIQMLALIGYIEKVIEND